VIASLHFRPDPADQDFQARAEQVLRVLAGRPGFLRGALGRATDDENAWLLLTEWQSVGAYRRGLGNYEVKLVGSTLLAQAVDQPSAFEPLLALDSDGSERVRDSDRAVDADWAPRTAPDSS
jgi:quinol monooxygenase YgiN